MSEKLNGQKCCLKNNSEKDISRRDFLGLAAFWACVSALGMAFVGALKFPKPALLPDVSNIFKIGRLQDIPQGTEKVFEDKKVLVIRTAKGVSAVSLICTHLGCIVSMTETGFSCPCHGSKFDKQGNIIAGPAPKGLNWLAVSQLPSGKLVVNSGKKVPQGTVFVV